MQKKLSIIFTLAGILVVLLYFKPWRSTEIAQPRFFDRLPDADIIGKSNVLDLARSLTGTMYHYRLPFREFLTHEFILSQGKNFGLDLQKPVFFFMNEKEWEINDLGAMFIVADSSNLRIGIEKLGQLIGLTDTTIYGQKVFKQQRHGLYFSYGADWMLVYQGKKFKRVLNNVLFAKRNEIPPKWRAFLNKKEFTKSSIVAEVTSVNLRKHGIASSIITLSNDSTHITFHTRIHQSDTLSIQLKDSGPSFKHQAFTRTLFNLHFDTERLRNDTQSPLYIAMKKVGAKIGFPVTDLLNAWEGDIAFRQGGIEWIKEKYIESELDDNFNVTEVVKYKNVKVSGFSLYLSMNDKSQLLIDRLLEKGIMTKDDRKFRLLYSPPLQMHLNDTSLIFHTSKFSPVLYDSSTNAATWTYNYTPYTFSLDSTTTKTIYGSVTIPLDKLIKDHMPIYDN